MQNYHFFNFYSTFVGGVRTHDLLDFSYFCLLETNSSGSHIVKAILIRFSGNLPFSLAQRLKIKNYHVFKIFILLLKEGFEPIISWILSCFCLHGIFNSRDNSFKVILIRFLGNFPFSHASR